MKTGNAARTPAFAARFATMAMHRLQIDDRNLELIERSIRRIAAGHRKDADRWTDQSMRVRAIECAEELDRIAERMKRCRETRGG